MKDEKKYKIFGEDFVESERAKLDSKLIVPQLKTNIYTDIEEHENEAILELRPNYPNWAQIELATSNLKDIEEERAIRAVMEVGLSLERFAKTQYEIIEVDKEEFVKLPDDFKNILVVEGFIPPEGKILVSMEDDEGNMALVEKQVTELTPVFRILTAKENEKFNVFELKKIKRKIKKYLDLSPICWKLFNFCMTRLALTKSRNLEVAKLLHSQFSNIKTQEYSVSPEKEEEEEGGLLK